MTSSEVRRLEERVRETGAVGRKTMELEILKEDLELAPAKKNELAVALVASRRYPVTTISQSVSAARSRRGLAGSGSISNSAMLAWSAP
jgi:hypothetical protein